MRPCRESQSGAVVATIRRPTSLALFDLQSFPFFPSHPKKLGLRPKEVAILRRVSLGRHSRIPPPWPPHHHRHYCSRFHHKSILLTDLFLFLHRHNCKLGRFGTIKTLRQALWAIATGRRLGSLSTLLPRPPPKPPDCHTHTSSVPGQCPLARWFGANPPPYIGCVQLRPEQPSGCPLDSPPSRGIVARELD